MEAEIDRLTDLQSVREKYLKALPKEITVVNDDGEVITHSPPQKKQSYGLKVTLK